MYFLSEGSSRSDKPHIIRIDDPPASCKDNQPLFFPEESVAKWFFNNGMAEKNLINWITETFIRPDKLFIDIGAHIGTYSWMCGKNAKHTYAFECGPTAFCYLAANIALHRLTEKISPLPFALGNREGEVEYIIRSKDGGGNGVLPLSEMDISRKKYKCFMKRLDSYNFTDIGFIKIDVEGFEKSVIEGATKTLIENNYPAILFESWGAWKEKEGVNAKKLQSELFEYIHSIGYDIRSVSGHQDMYLATRKI